MSSPKTKHVLLSFVGFHDPFFIGPADSEQREGPLLSLLRGKPFDVAVVISTPNTNDRTVQAMEAVAERFPDIEAVHHHVELSDPTDYFEVLPGLRSVLRDVRECYEDGQYFIGTASGTPQMHTCWVLLTASGEFPARLLQTRPPRFVTEDKPPFSEIDPSNSQFPIIRPNVWGDPQIDSNESLQDAELIKKLGIVGDHPEFKKALQQACIVGRSNEPALILGESGTGKELIAQLVWRSSDRGNKPFVAVNCSAIPDNLAESTLFGHKKGSFTDASNDRVGKFQEADGGTIFLDEIGELAPEVQAKLLRTVEQGEIEPVGGSTKKVDVRIIAATNRKLTAESQENNFRQDLYFRLNVGQIDLPSMKQRRSDISKLAMAFLDSQCQSLKQRKSFTPEAIQKLESYSWPGNIRELQNAIKRAVLNSQDSKITADNIQVQLETMSTSLQHLPTPQDGFSIKDYLELVRSELYDRALELSGNSQTRAKELLGVSDNAVSKHVKKKRGEVDSTEVE